MSICDRRAKGRINAVGALRGNELPTVSLSDGSINSDVFIARIKQDLLPKILGKSVIVTDNAAFHKRRDVQEAAAAGHIIEYMLIGITPIMDWAREYYDKEYAPNTRETIRRQTMHQFCDAGVVLYNPDKPDRPVNSPKAVYQIEPAALALLRSFDTSAWYDNLTAYLAERETLVAR